MEFITKKHISRRTVLRGLGVTVALPLLDAMVPAQTLLAHLSNIGQPPADDVIRLPPTLVVRGSTAPPRGA